MRSLLVFAALCIAIWGAQAAAQPASSSASSLPPGPPSYEFLHLWGDGHAGDARVALGGKGNIFLAGTSSSATWPAPWNHACATAPRLSCSHIFLEKLGRGGGYTYYTVQLGGSRQDRVTGLAVDAAGYAYVTGTTTSPDFPTVRALQPHCGGPGACSDGFVARIDPRGHVVYSTFLGGNRSDGPNSIAADRWGNAYVAGGTESTSFPTVRPMQPRLRGGWDGFITKIAPSGKGIMYSTYLGGSKDDGVAAVAVDSWGEAYVAGSTGSADFRTSGRSLQPSYLGGNCTFFACDDGFITKIGTNGRFLAGTFFGTLANDNATAIALDGRRDVYVAGSTGASRIPSRQETVSSGKAYCGEEGDIFPCDSAFVAELTPGLDRLVYSNVLRGSGRDAASSLAVDSGGDALLGGYTESTDFPTVHPIQAANGGGECSEGKGGSAPCDGFVSVLAPRGRSILFSTYVGGDGMDRVSSVATDGQGAVVFAGDSWSIQIPPSTDTASGTSPRLLFGKIDRAY